MALEKEKHVPPSSSAVSSSSPMVVAPRVPPSSPVASSDTAATLARSHQLLREFEEFKKEWEQKKKNKQKKKRSKWRCRTACALCVVVRAARAPYDRVFSSRGRRHSAPYDLSTSLAFSSWTIVTCSIRGG